MVVEFEVLGNWVFLCLESIKFVKREIGTLV